MTDKQHNRRFSPQFVDKVILVGGRVWAGTAVVLGLVLLVTIFTLASGWFTQSVAVGLVKTAVAASLIATNFILATLILEMTTDLVNNRICGRYKRANKSV